MSKQVRDLQPGEQFRHPVTDELLTAKMVTEFTPPAPAGVVGAEPMVKITVYEWPDELGKFITLAPHVALGPVT